MIKAVMTFAILAEPLAAANIHALTVIQPEGELSL
jgi:hypothetical protein